MRKALLVLLILLGAAGSVAVYRKSTEKRRAWQRFLTYERLDLRFVDKARAEFSLSELADASAKFEPRWIVRLDRRIVVIESTPAPASNSMRARVFDDEGNQLSSVEYSAGWRIVITHARVAARPDFGEAILECESGPLGPYEGGRDIRKQYYALVDDHLALIRLEERGGVGVGNEYDDPSRMIGPPPPAGTTQEVENTLNSHHSAEVLRALMWLGGRHPEPSPASAPRRMARIRARLEDLKRSPNPWIREAAAAVK